VIQRPTIFVSIASYRDPDCQNTVRDLFEKAAYPDRVYLGICWQFIPGEDDDCFALTTRPKQVRRIDVDASESRGVCWARSRVQELWRGEDYYLQIDSHMRFVAGWDERLISMLGRCPAAKPVLSTYPLAFTPPDQLAQDAIVTIHPKAFDEHGILAQKSYLTPIEQAPALPAPNAFIGAGLIFARGNFVEEVPYDPYLYFSGEEISLAVRLWTKGWDVFTPNEVIAYHDYGNRPDRPRHWKDQTDWAALGNRSWRRIRHMLEMAASSDPEDLRELEKYGLGKLRSLGDYESLAQLDFKCRLYQGKPLLLDTLAADQPSQAAARTSIFSYIWKEHFWKCDETRSGQGASMAMTAGLRSRLPELFEFLNIRILADAGCGDLNWMKELAGQFRFYFGYDIVPELVAELRARYAGQRQWNFAAADVVTDVLPECDAIICRDCLTHLPPDAALRSLQAFRKSAARFLIATTHSVGRNVWVDSGGWYPMDLTAAPFKLPPPRNQIVDSGSKMLGVWAIEDLPAP